MDGQDEAHRAALAKADEASAQIIAIAAMSDDFRASERNRQEVQNDQRKQLRHALNRGKTPHCLLLKTF